MLCIVMSFLWHGACPPSGVLDGPPPQASKRLYRIPQGLEVINAISASIQRGMAAIAELRQGGMNDE